MTIAEDAKERARAAEAKLHALTPRQREVLNLLADDLGNKEIAYRLGIDEKTVKMHRGSALARLGIGSSGAVRLVVEASFAGAFVESDQEH